MKRKNLILACATVCLATILKRIGREKKKSKRKWWIRPGLKLRPDKGFYGTFHDKLRLNDSKWFKNFIRMNEEDFNFLFERVKPFIKKKDTRFRKAISVGESLALTLRYLATGDSFASLMCLFLTGKSTISNIIKETCKALYESLKSDFLKMSNSIEKWDAISKKFEERWNFPHCCGALDGKHVKIQAPPNCGSEHFCYKQHNSIVWMALVYADYKFIYIDVGALGRDSDGGVFSRCSLSTALEKNTLHFPQPKALPEETQKLPFLVVADDAFPLKTYIQKQYNHRDQLMSHKIFNYRLSRARNVVENAFGICASRFRILRRPMDVKIDSVKEVVVAICSLHNFLISRKSGYTNRSDFDHDTNGQEHYGCWRSELNHNEILSSVQPDTCIGRPTANALEVREAFTQYFMTPHGELPWQYNRKILH